MKTVILCGGLGTRLAEETSIRPKPMVTIGERPILWHIMHIYAVAGHREFILPLGYKGEYIKQYFLNYALCNNDCEINLRDGTTKALSQQAVDWDIKMIDTGLNTLTGGRLHRLEPYLQDEQTFMLTYGDGVANIDVEAVLAFHKSHGKIATLTAVRPPARFGTMEFSGDQVVNFAEKPQTGEGWINGGFFVFNREIFNYLSGDKTVLEAEPLSTLATDGQLMAYRHDGFWQCMDTLRDKNTLNQLWSSNKAPWKVW